MNTVFQRSEISEPALFTPSDTTKAVDDFPEICVSTFSENIIQKFSSLNGTEKIAELYTANGAMPVYKIHYKDTDIAFYQSRVGAPACVAGFEEIVAMGARKFVLFGSCGILDDDKVKDKIVSFCMEQTALVLTNGKSETWSYTGLPMRKNICCWLLSVV